MAKTERRPRQRRKTPLPKSIELAVRAAEDKKADDITVLDLRNAHGFTDYFVICSGKNVIARELHLRGKRAKQPFVTIDCPSLSTSLIDSELFGHERGAFTDAVTAKAGRFELARAGTVYLDAVNELAVEAQSKLLRIVEEKRVERLGGQKSVAVEAR